MKKDGTARKTKTANDYAIISGKLCFEGDYQCDLLSDRFADMLDEKHVKSIRVVSLSSNWVERIWVDWNTSIDAHIDLEMTLRKETRKGINYWYAYRRKGGVLQKRYIGKSSDCTEKKILEVAQRML